MWLVPARVLLPEVGNRLLVPVGSSRVVELVQREQCIPLRGGQDGQPLLETISDGGKSKGLTGTLASTSGLARQLLPLTATATTRPATVMSYRLSNQSGLAHSSLASAAAFAAVLPAQPGAVVEVWAAVLLPW